MTKIIPQLRDYQIADLAFMIANPKCMLLGDPGTGKTPPACVMMWHLWNDHGVGTAWSMPKSLLDKNRDEVLRFTHFTEDQVVIVDNPTMLSKSQVTMIEDIHTGAMTKMEYVKGPKKVTANKLLSLGLIAERKDKTLFVTVKGASAYGGTPLEFLGNGVVFLMGFDRYGRSWEQLPEFVKALFIDEFHKGYKGNNSNRTQTMYAANENGRCKWFVPMTGTLIDGRLDTAYPAISIIDHRYYLSHDAFMNFHSFRDEYDRVLWWQNHDKLSEILGRHGIRRTFEMVYGKSKVVVIPEVVHMSPKQRELYDKFNDQAFLELEKFFVDGTQPGVSFIRARQLMEHPNHFPDLTSPGFYVDALKGEVPAKMERLRMYAEDAADLGKPIVVFSPLKPQQVQVSKMLTELGINHAVLNGDTSRKDRNAADKDFQAGKLQGLVVSPEVADVGYNWQFWGDQEVEVIDFLAMDVRDTAFVQAIRRFERGPRKTSLRVRVHQYHNSIDQRILEIVKIKSKMANLVDPTREVFDLAVK